MSLLSDKTVAQLKELATELGVSFKSKIRKADLIPAIEAADAEFGPPLSSHKRVCSNLEFASSEKESEDEEKPTTTPDPQIGAKRFSSFMWAKHKAKAKAKRKQQQASRRRNRRR